LDQKKYSNECESAAKECGGSSFVLRHRNRTLVSCVLVSVVAIAMIAWLCVLGWGLTSAVGWLWTGIRNLLAGVA